MPRPVRVAAAAASHRFPGRALCGVAVRCFLYLMLATRAAAIGAAPPPAAAPPPPPPYRLESLNHVGQWIGVNDAQARKVGLRATDLGVSFPVTARGGRTELMFLFGDTHPYGEPFVGRWDEDSVAVAPADWTRRDRPPALRWLTRPDGQFASLLVPGEDLRAMDVPLDGIQVPAGAGGAGGAAAGASRILLFFNAGYDKAKHGHAALVCAEAPNGDVRKLTKRFKQPTTKFLNVSVSPDPADSQTVWIFGTGQYRRSPVYLAKAPAATLDDFSTWRFLAGGGAGGAGAGAGGAGGAGAGGAGEVWAAREEEAASLIDGAMGELSARWIPAARQWAMMYQRRRPQTRGQAIYLRFAPRPTGPWSAEVPVLEPDAAAGVGFTQFMHASEAEVKFDDGLANPGRESDWGDPYGAYLVPEWCRIDEDGRRLRLVHTLSAWNPYSVHLMETVLTPQGDPPAAPTAAASAPSPEVRPGAPFPSLGAAKKGADGNWVAQPKSPVTRRVRWVVPPQAKWLTFKLRGAGGGGDAAATLLDENGNYLRASRPDGSGVRTARWRVDNLRGRAVTFEYPAAAGGAGGIELTQPVVEPN